MDLVLRCTRRDRAVLSSGGAAAAWLKEERTLLMGTPICNGFDSIALPPFDMGAISIAMAGPPTCLSNKKKEEKKKREKKKRVNLHPRVHRNNSCFSGSFAFF